MTATAHAIVGGAIAASITDPILGVSLAFLSHPLLDMVPHWDAGWGWRKKTKKRLFLEASADAILGIVLALLFFGWTTPLWYLAVCVLAAELLDILEIPYWFWKWEFPPFGWIYKFQSKIQGKAALPWGLITQIVACGLIFLMLQYVQLLLI